jgi:hypothetical protein
LYSRRDNPRLGNKLLIRRFKANRRKVFKATLLLTLFSIFGLGGVLAATTITLNQGAPIALGAGYTASTACDSSITINTQNQFINNKFMVSTISLSNIDATYPNGCGSSVLDLSLVVNGSLVNTSFSIASSASNNNYLFGGSAGTGFLANSVLIPFDISQLTSVALSAYKVSVVSYAVGDTGPGGGKVFYVSATPFTCGPTLNLTCTYLEAAPSGWNSLAESTGRAWANTSYISTDVTGITNNYPSNTSSTGLGLGYRNSIAIVDQGNNTSTAAGAARAYTGGSKSDWYLPTSAELNLLCQWAYGAVPSLSGGCGSGTLNTATYGAAGFVGNRYWSSDEKDSDFAYWVHFGNGSLGDYFKGDTTYKVRAIRAF